MSPRCKAHRVERWKGKWDRLLPCREEAVDGPYCEKHTPACPEKDCKRKAWPAGKAIMGLWHHTKDGWQFEGTVKIICDVGHIHTVPVPKHLAPKRPKRKAMRGF